MKKRFVCFVLQALFLCMAVTCAYAMDQQKLCDGAVKLMEESCYEEAKAVLDVLGIYQDSQTLVAECEQQLGDIAQAAQTGTDTLDLLVQATLADANHVGNEWAPAFYANGEFLAWTKAEERAFEITSATVHVSKGDTLLLKCIIEEMDTYPDIGKYQEEIAVTEDLLQNGTSMTWTVTVQENMGRYSGREAEWQVLITITPST